MHYQAYDVNKIREGVKEYGVAGGARVMMSNEYLHAEEAVQSGIYITYYCEAKKSDCFRVGSNSKCFCGHLFKEHNKSIGAKKINTSCLNCPCKAFAYIPTRPEECGMWWLPRRKEFDVRTWKAKCKCKHTHEEHMPTRPLRCKMCGTCSDFHSDFACISCDMAWHDHQVLYETEQERRALKKPVGKDYYPLAQNEDIQEMVFDPEQMNKVTPFMRPRPNSQAPLKKPAITQPKVTPKITYQGNNQEEVKINEPKNYGVGGGNSFSKALPTQKVGIQKPISNINIGMKPSPKPMIGVSSYPVTKSATKLQDNQPTGPGKNVMKSGFKPTYD